MSVQWPNAVARSHSNAASACQTAVPPGAKKPLGAPLNELFVSKQQRKKFDRPKAASAGTT